MTLKLLFAADGRVLGAQGVGAEGVEKQIDVVSQTMHFAGTVRDLAEAEMCYAPPYNSAKSPVNMMGFVASNVLDGLMTPVSPEEVGEGDLVLDVRTPQEFVAGHIEGSVNIPLGRTARKARRGAELDADRRHLCGGAARIYRGAHPCGHGIKAENLTGGYRMYVLAKKSGDRHKRKMTS